MAEFRFCDSFYCLQNLSYGFLLNLFNTFPTIWTIGVAFLFAISLPIAFPPTVIAATNALIINWISNAIWKFSVILIEISALIAPLNTPHISPITSAQKLATFEAFFIRCIDCLDPSTFFVAFAWNSSSFATVTATPIISKIIPIKITKINIRIAGITSNPFNAFVDMKENVIDSMNVVINTVINHFNPELSLLSFLLFCFSIFIQSFLTSNPYF